MKRTRLERQVFFRSLAIGICLTVLVLLARALGLLDSLEYWLYDERAVYCQVRAVQPTTRLAHVDIDDDSINVLGRWPWPRETQARILMEIERAKPSAVGLDIMLSESEPPVIEELPDGKYRKENRDQDLARVFRDGSPTVLAASFRVEGNEAETPEMMEAVNLLLPNLEMTPEDFRKQITQINAKEKETGGFDEFYAMAARRAMTKRINEELDRDPNIAPEALFKLLLPHTDPNGIAPLRKVFEDELRIPDAAHRIRRFSAPVPPSLALRPVQGDVSVIPLPIFTQYVNSVAFANFNIFDTAKIRSVPLFVESGGRLYPQFGFATACAVLGADMTRFHMDGDTVVIPAPGGDVRIPTVQYHSKVLDRDVPLIALVPWFGTNVWETMYDWPDHKLRSGHTSIARVWDICAWEDRIKSNSRNIDVAVDRILNDQEQDLGVDPDLARKYAALNLDPLDVDSRDNWAKTAIKAEQDFGLEQQFAQMNEAQMSSNDKYHRDELHAALNTLNTLVPQSRELNNKIRAQRDSLRSQLSGKGVLIGFTATGLQDQVSTSIHVTCPGVVVHGVIASAVLTGQWWHVAPAWIEYLLAIIFGLTTAEALGRYSAPRASLLATALMVGYAGVNGALIFGWMHWIVGLAAPMVCIITVWAGCTLYRLTVEAIERSRVGLELAATSREMDLARQVQVALIPTASPKVVGLESEGWALTASVAGGDCYDLWQLKDGRLAVLLADASGHGLAPAMVVSQVRTLCRSLSDFENHPHGLLDRVNRRLADDLEANRFVTAFLGFLDSKGTLEWASAGHGPMFWCPDGDGKMLELDSTGLPLGIQPDCFFDAPMPPLQLHAGGSLVVFSDGIFEAPAPDGNMFGVERVKEILEKHASAGCAAVLEALRSSVQKWQQKLEPVDDQTIVVVRRIMEES